MMDRLAERVHEALDGTQSVDASAVERELVASLAAVGRAVMAELLAAMAPKGADVIVNGARLKEVFRGLHQYTTCFGVVSVERKFEQLCGILHDRPQGVETVIRSLAQLRPARRGDHRDWRTGVNYLKRHRHKMDYAGLRQLNLPFGSGVIEATCKSLVSDRLKRAGMRWDKRGGQAILNLRAWTQSDRFDRAWQLLSDTYTAEIFDFDSDLALAA